MARPSSEAVFLPSTSGETFVCISPVDGRVLAQVVYCGAEDVSRAGRRCPRLVFDAGVWSGQAPKARKRMLLKFAELIAERAMELALLETLDMGKPVSDARRDVAAVVECVRWLPRVDRQALR